MMTKVKVIYEILLVFFVSQTENSQQGWSNSRVRYWIGQSQMAGTLERSDDEEYTSDIDYEAGKGVIGINDKFRLYQHHQ